MIVIMNMNRTEAQRDAVMTRLQDLGLRGQEIQGVSRTVIAVLGNVFPELRDELSVMGGVEDVLRLRRLALFELWLWTTSTAEGGCTTMS